MRVLHLLEAGSGGRGGWHEEAVLACRAALEAGKGEIEHEVWLIGPAESVRRAADTGVIVSRSLCPQGGIPEYAWRAGRRMFAGIARPDVVMAWSVGALALARASGIRARADFGALLDDPVGGGADRCWGGRGLQRTLAFRDATTFTLSSALAARWRSAGSEDTRVLPIPLQPAGDIEKARAAALRSEIRRRLGLEPTEIAVLLLADPARRGNLRRFVFLVGLLHVTGQRVVAIAPAGAAERDRAARFVRAHDRVWRLLEWEGGGGLSDILAGVDLGVCDAAYGQGPDVLTAGPALLAAASQAGLPLVSGPHWLCDEMIAAGAKFHMARTFEPTGLAAAAVAALHHESDAGLVTTAAPPPPGPAFADVLLQLWRERLGDSAPRPEVVGPVGAAV